MRVQFWERYGNPPLAKDSKYNFKQFSVIEVLGEGSFGKVLLVEQKKEKKYYALKIMKKDFLVDQGQVDPIFEHRLAVLTVSVVLWEGQACNG
jgi:serine/threonine protein kinase